MPTRAAASIAGLEMWPGVILPPGCGLACYDGAVEQVRTLDELRELCADPLILWAAQDIGSNIQVWAHGSAVIVAVTGLARRDRAAVTGQVTDIATVMQALLAGRGPRYRALGDDAIISRLCQVLTGLAPTPPFGWMTTSHAPSHGASSARLASNGEHAAIAQVLDEVFPDSLARPGLPGVTRWWVETDHLGVVACACRKTVAPTRRRA